MIAILMGSVAAVVVCRDLISGKAPGAQAASLQNGLPLQLSVTENRNELEVTWNRSVPAILHAKRGVLSISDGSVHQDLEMDGAQLRTGKVHYSPLSSDLKMRLEVFSEGPQQVRESIRVFNEPSH